MRFELYKIMAPEFVDSFIQGNLYMNTLDYFRSIENNKAQGDYQEGICGTIKKSQLGQIGYQLPKYLLDNMLCDNIPLSSDYYAMNNLFCMYSLKIDDDRLTVYKPNKQIYEFNDENGEQKVVVRITDTDEFLRRLNKALEKYVNRNVIEYGIYGDISYCSSFTNANGMGSRSAFHKEPSYEYQNEWRICILQKLLGKTAFVLKIGDISDIVEKHCLDTFVNSLENIYPEYTAVSDTSNTPTNAYKAIGSINMTNNLMYSYMKSNNQIIRSDTAQANWHYAQYLILKGEYEKADKHLENEMKKHKDFDHLDLLVQHRTPHHWVKATDAYMFFMNEYTDLIKSDPYRFFFGIHTILMVNQEASDAAKMYLLAQRDYQLGEQLDMYSDFMFALGFYDKVIPIFENMKSNKKDPILMYDLAIAYTFTLNFSKAIENILEYEEYFLNTVRGSENIKQIKQLLQCFNDEKPIEILQTPDKADIKKSSIDTIANIIKDRTALLGIDTLYNLSESNSLYLLNSANEIQISTKTVEELMKMYMASGDINIYNLIIYLKRLANLKILSSDIKHYLAVELKNQDLPGFMIMERALNIEHKFYSIKNS